MASIQISREAERVVLETPIDLNLKWKAAAAPLYVQFADRATGLGRAQPYPAQLSQDGTRASFSVPALLWRSGSTAARCPPSCAPMPNARPSTPPRPSRCRNRGACERPAPAAAPGKLLVSRAAVALTAAPGASVLTRELTVTDDTFSDAGWIAKSD